MKRKSDAIVVSLNGEPCPKCGRKMQVRKHSGFEMKHLNKPYFFTEWDYCPGCRHVQHYEEYKVVKPVIWDETWPDDKPNQDEKPPWEDKS